MTPPIEPGENVVVAGEMWGEVLIRNDSSVFGMYIVYVFGSDSIHPIRCHSDHVRRVVSVPSWN